MRKPGKMGAMMSPSEFRDVVQEMKAVNAVHFFCDLRKDSPLPHWCAQTWENISRDEYEARIGRWLELGTRPHASLVITADPYYIGVHLLVRGAFSEEDQLAVG
jgi:hypothetical protein